MDFFNERKVVKRKADLVEYTILGIPVGLFPESRKHGIKKAFQHYWAMRKFDSSRPSRYYQKVWNSEEVRLYRMGKRKDLHPVETELRRRRDFRE